MYRRTGKTFLPVTVIIVVATLDRWLQMSALCVNFRRLWEFFFFFTPNARINSQKFSDKPNSRDFFKTGLDDSGPDTCGGQKVRFTRSDLTRLHARLVRCVWTQRIFIEIYQVESLPWKTWVGPLNRTCILLLITNDGHSVSNSYIEP